MAERYGELNPLDRRFFRNLLRALRREEIEPRKVGRGYLVLGVVMSLGSLAALAAPDAPVQRLPPPLAPVRALFEDLGSLAAAQVGLGLLLVLSSLAFLRGHRWSRIGLDLFTLAFAAWAVYFGVLWEQVVWSMTVAQEGAGVFRVFGVAMMVGGAFVTGSFVLLAALAIRYLHGPRVRDHFSRPGARPNPMLR